MGDRRYICVRHSNKLLNCPKQNWREGGRFLIGLPKTELNKNRLNRWLNHTPIFPGRSTLIQNPNYNKSRKRTSDTDTAAISSDAEDVDPGTCSRVENNKKRKTIFQGSRCVVCTKIVGAESAAKVMTRCPTCNVFLCALPRGRNKHSC